MAGKITALKIQKRNKERVNVYLDDRYEFSVTLLAAVALKKGQYLSDAEIERLQYEDAYQKAYHQALRFLGIRARSQSEMERYLLKKGYTPQIVAATLERLLHEHYLDDRAFARSWLESRARLKPKGSRALRHELKQKGIADEVIEAALMELDEENLAWAAVEPKLSRWKTLDAESFKKKLWGFLGRRGFDYEVTRRIFEKARTSLDILE